MDVWEQSLQVQEGRGRHGRKNPSFSSTLLDSIYRSIDEGNGEGEEELVLYRETMRKKQSSSTINEQEGMASLRRACMIEEWMEKKVSEKVVIRRKSDPDLDRKLQNDRNSVLLNSTSSSSDSSCGGGFSSSEAESGYGARSRTRSRSSGFVEQRPKPIRTGVSARSERSEKPLNYDQREFYLFDDYHHQRNTVPPQQQQQQQQQPKHEVKTKSRALKIYGDLRKVKQPISPGGRLASFLNSLFTVGNAKKAKISSSINGVEDTSSERKSKSAQASTCSSASSFSRSCLSKTPSSRGKLSNGTKRSVRFYPVSVIVDEDSRPCGHKCLYEDEPGLMAVTSVEEKLKFHLMEKNRRVEAAARDLLQGYQKKRDFNMRDLHDDDEDDAASCSSSDLFELDHLSAIGVQRYREELPVYETTHLHTNRAIANGLIL
ncbi:hypothetical protein HHK36_021803 [Tetracentron sinense]|uniref:Protein BIG GRAIN 1-like A n=1 Tax=Tetracentron sinense TaxID=13715 RepID=A0A835DAZ7_TETSI|nr:hypothetical protein HHK36_021803 [Tetracentron sinense]